MIKNLKKIWANHSVFQDNNTKENFWVRIRWHNKILKEWITYIKLLRGDLRNLNVHIDDIEIMTQILSEYYKNML